LQYKDCLQQLLVDTINA